MVVAVIFAIIGTAVLPGLAQPTKQPADIRVVKVATFNIKYDEPRDGINSWPNRKQMVADIILEHDLDIIGVQEALHHQLKDLEALLPDIAWCGVGRDEGNEKGEYSAILYKRSRFTLLKTGTFWLSERPDEPGSKGWDAALPRVVTWAKFRDLKTRKTFFHFNTHFDHRGEIARVNSSRLLLERIGRIAKKAKVVITGDLNANYSTEVYKTLVGSGIKSTPRPFDAKRISEIKYEGPDSTFNGFKELVPNSWIDHIFVSKGIRVLRFSALDERPEGRWPSDHLPLVAEISFEQKKDVRK